MGSAFCMVNEAVTMKKMSNWNVTSIIGVMSISASSGCDFSTTLSSSSSSSAIASIGTPGMELLVPASHSGCSCGVLMATPENTGKPSGFSAVMEAAAGGGSAGAGKAISTSVSQT